METNISSRATRWLQLSMSFGAHFKSSHSEASNSAITDAIIMSIKNNYTVLDYATVRRLINVLKPHNKEPREFTAMVTVSIG